MYSTLMHLSLVQNSKSQTRNLHLWLRPILLTVLPFWFLMKITNRFNARPASRFSFSFSTQQHLKYLLVTVNA